jgi:hypothetical protein
MQSFANGSQKFGTTLLRPSHALYRPQGAQLHPHQRCSRVGDFHALMQALQGAASSDPDPHLIGKQKDATALQLKPQAGWPIFWAALQARAQS